MICSFVCRGVTVGGVSSFFGDSWCAQGKKSHNGKVEDSHNFYVSFFVQRGCVGSHDFSACFFGSGLRRLVGLSIPACVRKGGRASFVLVQGGFDKSDILMHVP